MITRRRLLALLSVILVLATGCDGPEPPRIDTGPPVSGDPATHTPSPTPSPTPTPAPAPAPTILHPGKYTFNAPTGATGTMEIPAAPVSEIEDFRSFLKESPVTYLTAVVDNRQGSVAIHMDSVSIFTPTGAEYRYQRASDYLDKLRDELPADTPAEARNRFDDLFDAHLGDAPPLAVKDFVLVGPAVPPEISEIIVHPTSGFHPVAAVPAD